MITRKQRILAVGVAAASAAAVAFGAIVFGGAVTVAATDPHYAPVQWVLETTMESSIRAHASEVEVPPNLDLHDPKLAEQAFGHYSVACTPCHGAPGVDAAPWLVLNPPAEPLVETAARWSDAELYWIVKNGIKMTGMPALGPTHGDGDLWAIAAFVRQLPAMTADDYRAMAERHAASHDHAMAVPAPPAVTPREPPPVDVAAPMIGEEPSSTSTAAQPAKRRTAPRRSARPRAETESENPSPTTAVPQTPHHEHVGHHH
jgi:mono/diheme cytochrome c family protein